jgi:hypothetical protein
VSAAALAAAPIERLRSCWDREGALFPAFLVEAGAVASDLDALDGLLARLPPGDLIVRASAAHPGAPMERLAASPGRGLLERLRGGGVHVMALDLQRHDPGFAELLERFVAAVAPVVAASGQRIVRPMVGLFCSSPGSLVHYHADPEHNFLFQVRGGKSLRLFPGDARCFPPEARERLFCERVHSLAYSESFEDGAQALELAPGTSTYQPMLRPHWVRCHDELSVSIGFSLYTDVARRQRRIHLVNRRLRSVGIRPAAPGRDSLRDACKHWLGAALSAASAAARRAPRA